MKALDWLELGAGRWFVVVRSVWKHIDESSGEIDRKEFVRLAASASPVVFGLIGFVWGLVRYDRLTGVN